MAASAVAAVAVVVLVAGVPLALVRWVGWPLVTPPATVLAGLRYGTVSDDVLLTALTVVVWVAWVQLTMALAVEAAAAVRGRLARRLALAGVFQPVAARVVATLAVVAATLLSRPPSAGAEPSACAAVASATADPDGPSRPADGKARAPVYLVQRHDTLWGIAERRLGDGRRWREIHALNLGRRQPDGGALGIDSEVLHVGWRLRLPTDDPSDDPLPAHAVTVTAGDTLSGLATEHLGDAERWPRLYAATVGRPQPDGRTLSDPDVLLPGWKVAGARHTPIRAPRRDRPPADQRGWPTPPGTPDARLRREDPGPSDQSSPSAAPMPRSSAGPTESPRSTPPVRVDPADRGPAGDETGGWMSWLVPSGVAAIIAGWLVARRRVWLRRRKVGDRRTTSEDHPHRQPADPDALMVPPRQRAAAAVAWLIDEATRLDVWLPRIAGATIDATGTVTVLLVDNAPEHLPAGWERDRSDPRQARLPAGVAPPGDSGQPTAGRTVVATLVTLGTGVHSAQQLLVTLASCRHLAVSGPDDSVVETMLAWALELAGDRHAMVDVWLAGFDLPESSTATGAFARLHVVTTVAEVVDRLPIAMAQRKAAAERDDHDAVVLCAPDVAEDDVRRVHRLVRTDGLAVAAVTAFDDGSGWTVNVSTDEVAVTSLRQGVVLHAHRRVAPTAFDDAARQVTAARVDAVATRADAPAETVESAAVESAAALLERIAVPAGLAVPPGDGDWDDLVVVRLLGDVRVETASGDRVSGGLATEVIAYLACHRHAVTTDRLMDAVWNGERIARRRMAELVSRARRTLGGTARLPHADHGRYRLDASVVTDIELMAWRVAQARRHPAAIEHSLTAAVDLIGGRPFADVDWPWAVFEGLATDAAAFACDVAATLGEWHLERRNPAAALQAAQAGIRAVPDSEQLARLRMRAYHQRGEIHQIHAVIADLRAAGADDPDSELHPATVALYRALVDNR